MKDVDKKRKGVHSTVDIQSTLYLHLQNGMEFLTHLFPMHSFSTP